MKKVIPLLFVLVLLSLLRFGLAPKDDTGWTRLNAGDKALPITPPPGVAVEEPAELPDKTDPLAPVLIACKLAFNQTINGQYAVDVDEENKKAVFYFWEDGLDGYALDAAMVRRTDLDIWENVKEALCSLNKTLQSKFDDAGRSDLCVEIRLVDPNDFTLLLASFSGGETVFDIVDATPPGEKVSVNLYGPEAADPWEDEYESGNANFYIINTSSKVFHLSGCPASDAISWENRSYRVATRTEMLRNGYTPCGRCNP